ncbi:MAG: hypothetical protein FWG30_03035 [Eubacteriaceae bacterium]|nr:hypothetical protein [Eubacteriaceae bacterium]
MPKKIRKIRPKPNVLLNISVIILLANFIINTAAYQKQIINLKNLSSSLEQELASQTSLSKLYEDEIEKRQSQEYLEYIAKKHLGYLYPNERIVDIKVGEPK